MATTLLALAFPPTDIVGLLIWILIIGACVAIMYVALKAMGVEIPWWAKQIAIIVVVVIVAILAIRFVASL